MNNILPLGSIVALKNDKKKLIICGRKQMHVQLAQKFDYMGFLYPQGYISDHHTYLFNEEDIDKVIFKGYTDILEIKFRDLIME